MRYLFVGTAGPPEGIDELTARLAGSPLAGKLVVEDHEELIVLSLRGASFEDAQAFAGQGAAVLCDETQLLHEIENGTDALAVRAALLGLGALWHSDMRLLDVLRKLYAHPRPEVRAGVIAVASRVGYRLFLLELMGREEDPLLRRVLRSATAFPEESQA